MAAEGIAEVTTTTATSVVTLAVVTPATATTETAETSGLMTGITIYMGTTCSKCQKKFSMFLLER